jgi:hypothetical protein
MYNHVIYPLLKKYEPLIDQKLAQAQAATDECVQDIQANGSQAIARRVVAVQKSELVQNIAKAITQPPMSPRSSADVKDEDGSKTT